MGIAGARGRSGRARGSAAIVLALALVLTACGDLPWQTEPPSPTAAPTPTTAALDGVVDDLAAGSTERSLTAGGTTLEVTYWSDVPTDEWTAAATKPLSLSVTATVDGEVGVYLSRLRVVTDVRDADGQSLEAPEEFVDTATVQPGYAMQDPYSYATTVMLPAVEDDAAWLEVTLVYEVLVETEPGSGQVAKQTATDTLTVVLAAAS